MFKNLNLNREEIPAAIDEFCSEHFKTYNRSDIVDKGGTRRRVEICGDGVSFFMDFQYLKQGGGTSIEPHFGKHQDIKNKLAAYIANKCKVGNLKDKDSKFVASGIVEEDFNSIVELLKESNYYKGHSYKKQLYHHQHTFQGIYDEKMTVNHYFTTGKIMIQGRPLLLFYDAVTLITELLDPTNIPNVFNAMYELNIDKKNIIDQYEIYFPNSYDKHDDKLKNSLYQAIYNLNIKAEMFCYEGLVLPAFRAMEGHLKIVLYRDYNIECEDNKFTMFKYCKTDKKSYLKECYVNQIGNMNVVNYLNDTYNYFCSERHSLVHWDSPNELDPSSALTRTITNYIEAESIIRNILRKIDEYYLLQREQ